MDMKLSRKYGKLAEGSNKYWNSKGEPVDSWEEAGCTCDGSVASFEVSFRSMGSVLFTTPDVHFFGAGSVKLQEIRAGKAIS
jgi:hypothetical protein